MSWPSLLPSPAELASQLPAGGRPEAVVILRRLLGSCAFVPGCSGVRGKLPPDRLPFVRRPGSQTSLPPGMAGVPRLSGHHCLDCAGVGAWGTPGM